MTKDERENIIALLILWTNYNRSVFDNMSDSELLKFYDRYVGK